MDNKIYGEVSLTCPVCSAHFTTLLPAVPLIPSARRSDLKPLFEDNIDHFASLIQTCPVCMFAAWPCSFGHHSEAVDSLIERCTSRPGDRPLPVISSVENLTLPIASFGVNVEPHKAKQFFHIQLMTDVGIVQIMG